MSETNKKLDMVSFLDKQAIFAAGSKSLEPKSVHVEEWGGLVRYKPMTMTERREIRKKCQTVEMDPGTGERTNTIDAERFEIYALVYCCIDDKGKLLFNPTDVSTLESKMSAGPINTVSTAILKDSGLAPDSIKRGQSGTES